MKLLEHIENTLCQLTGRKVLEFVFVTILIFFTSIVVFIGSLSIHTLIMGLFMGICLMLGDLMAPY